MPLPKLSAQKYWQRLLRSLRPAARVSKVYLYTICLLVLYDFFENIVFPLTVRLLEYSICHQHFAISGTKHDQIRETDCKIREVQTRLAFVRGIYSLCRTIPAILIGPFFGTLADQVGRRVVYALCVTGLLLQILTLYIVCIFWQEFAIQTSWLTGMFIAIGGGQFVIVGLNFTMIADISDLRSRSQHLYLAFAIRYCADLISPQIAAQTLEHSLWLPLVIAVLCLGSSFPILFRMRETKPSKEDSRSVKPSHNKWFFNKSTLSLLRDRNIGVCLCITFLLQFRYLVESILIVYAPVRFGWTISQVTRLLSIIPAVSLGVFIVLPTLQKHLHEALTEQGKTRLVALVLIASLIVGNFMIDFAADTVWLVVALSVFAVGNGVRAPLLSVAVGYVDSTFSTARLYTLLSTTDALAHVIGDPALEFIWQAALNVGAPWLSLPFVVTTGIFIMAFVLMLWLPAKPALDATDSGGSDDVTKPLL